MRLDQNTPKVGYLLKTLPKLPERFILNETRQLERLKTRPHLSSLKKPALSERFAGGSTRVRQQESQAMAGAAR